MSDDDVKKVAKSWNLAIAERCPVYVDCTTTTTIDIERKTEWMEATIAGVRNINATPLRVTARSNR